MNITIQALQSYGARQKVSPISVIGYAFKEVGYSVNTVVKSLGMMFTGQVGINDLSGPVGTVSAMSNIVEESKADGTFYVILNRFKSCRTYKCQPWRYEPSSNTGT